MATIQASRGCASNCIYCLSPHLSGKKIRFRSPQNILDEMIVCYEKFKIKNFFLRADTFTINEVWVEEICNLIISSYLRGKIHFTVNSRVQPLKKGTLEVLKQAGCFAIAFGFESGCADTLEKIQKGTTVAENLQVARWTKELNIPMYAFFIIGFPWETRLHLETTKKHIYAINADYIEIHIALPYYGTKLYDLCRQAETLKKDTLGYDYYNSSTTGTEYLSMDEVIEFRRKTIREYYLRPIYILQKLQDCVMHPYKFWNYAKYALHMIGQTRRKP